MKKKKKISDQEFLIILRECAGIFSKTAEAIRQKYGIEYSRQAVRERAQRFADELEDIYQENLDIAEDGLHSIIKNGPDRIRLKAIEFFLKMKGKDRGYTTETIPVPYMSEAEKRIQNMSDEELDAEIKRLEEESKKYKNQ